MEFSRMGLRASRPRRALWALFAVTQGILQVPFWAVAYLIPQLRQNPNWTYRQAFLTRLAKYLLYHMSLLGVRTELSLEPGSEKDRFVVIPSATPELFQGPAAPDSEVQPQPIGGTWFPLPPSSRSQTTSAKSIRQETVVLHFHGGAYVVGSGRTADIAFGASIMLNEARVDRVLSVQYRLASNPGGRFPAALQDAISAYSFLLRELGVPAENVVVSGDSAGGGLALALLRYISEQGSEVGLPAPGCAWLWSPWVDPANVRDLRTWNDHPNEKFDWLSWAFGKWGVVAYSGNKLDPEDRYISPVRYPFRTETPVWIQTCGAEILLGEDAKMAQGMERMEGNRVELWVEPNAVHDICLVGDKLGFAKEAKACARRAGEFLRSVRSSF